MTVNDILALSKAGFTATQIAQMAAIPAQPAASVQPAAPAPVQPAAPAQPQGTTLDDVLKAIQASNIAASQQPKTESCEDILASIINPKEEK